MGHIFMYTTVRMYFIKINKMYCRRAAEFHWDSTVTCACWIVVLFFILEYFAGIYNQKIFIFPLLYTLFNYMWLRMRNESAFIMYYDE